MKMPPIHERLLQYAHTRDGITGEPLLEQTFRDDMGAAAEALAAREGLLEAKVRLVAENKALVDKLDSALGALRAYLDAGTWDAIHDAHNGARAILSAGVEKQMTEE